MRQGQGRLKEEFSFRFDLNRTYISSIERGKRNITLDTANRVSKSLGITSSSMISEIELEDDRAESNRRVALLAQ